MASAAFSGCWRRVHEGSGQIEALSLMVAVSRRRPSVAPRRSGGHRRAAAKPSLLRALWASHRKDLLVAALLSALEVATILAQPNVMRLSVA